MPLGTHSAPTRAKKTKPKRCKHCGKSGHVASDCWEKHPDKRLSKNTKNTGADTGKKPFPSGKVFCASRGAMCAGSAQVTLVKLRRSYYTGCKPNRRTKHPNTKTTQNQKHQKEGSNLLRNSCGRVRREREGETGALNSAKLSVLLVPQQTA